MPTSEKIGRTVALIAQLLIDAPLQKVQLIMQTNRFHQGLNGGSTKNFVATTIDIFKQQGLSGLWRGSGFYILTCTPVNILINALRPKILDEMIPNDYHERNEFYRFCVMLISGFAADVLTLALTSPISYVLT